MAIGFSANKGTTFRGSLDSVRRDEILSFIYAAAHLPEPGFCQKG